MKLIDLSVPLGPDIKDPLPFAIHYENHEASVGLMARLAGVEPGDFEDGRALAGETLTLTGHAGTHVDAPWHYWPTSEGRPARTIDQLPLEWFYGPGVVLDCLDRPDGYALTVADLQAALHALGYQLRPFDIVLIHTGTDQKMFDPAYAQSGPGVSAEATRWLIAQGIKVMGIDTWGWDIPLKFQAADYKRQPRRGVLFAAHLVGREHEYCQIEKLTNLGCLPKTGFRVSAFPVKVQGGSAGWTRAVAFVEEADLPPTAA